MTARALGIGLGYLADRAWGDPARFHPVAGFGRVAAALEARLHADARPPGVVFTAVLVGGSAAAGAAVDRAVAGRPVARTVLTAAATWAVLGGRSLGREARAVDALLAAGDLPGARQRLTHLVGRDPSRLDEAEVARATVESVAENTSDAVVAPLLAGAVGGIGGLLGYRAANTLDAMVGHLSPRYRSFGWASARLDDVLNLAPARVAAALAAVAAPTVGGRPGDAVVAWARDASGHPSPNAGPVEASFAGALGIRLGGTNVYGDRVEHRAVMGDGRSVVPADVERAVALAGRVGHGAAGLAVLIAGRRPRRARTRRR